MNTNEPEKPEPPKPQSLGWWAILLGNNMEPTLPAGPYASKEDLLQYHSMPYAIHEFVEGEGL
ncbi:hypothetical protein GCM10028807_62800 [Spirosoma daeguense]